MDHWNAQRDPWAAGPGKGEEEILLGPRFGTTPEPHHDQLAPFTIGLIGSLCWNVPNDIVGQ